MYKAADVTPPTRVAPLGNHPANRVQNNHHRFGPVPYRALANNNGLAMQNGVSMAIGAGKGRVEGDGGKAGAAAYWQDSFGVKRNNYGYNRDWVSLVELS